MNVLAVKSIQFLTKRSCSNAPVMHERMLQIFDADEFAVVDLGELPPDDPRLGYDTPTVLVDGRDVFGSVPRLDLSVPPS